MGSYSGSGSGAASYGGYTWTFTGWDDSQYTNLYHGVQNVWIHETSTSGPVNLTFQGMSGNEAVFGGQSIEIRYWDSYYQAWRYKWHEARFVLETTTTSNADLALTSVGSVSGLPSQLGAVLDVSGDYRVNWRFELKEYGYWYSALSVYSPGNDPSRSLEINVEGAWYYTPPPPAIPEPASIALVALGAAGLILKRRRKRSA